MSRRKIRRGARLGCRARLTCLTEGDRAITRSQAVEANSREHSDDPFTVGASRERIGIYACIDASAKSDCVLAFRPPMDAGREGAIPEAPGS